MRLGLECDFIAGQESWIEELAGAAPWDYLIGSVHYLAPGWDVDNPRHISRFDASETAVQEIWKFVLEGEFAQLRAQRAIRFPGAPRLGEEVRPPATGGFALLLCAGDFAALAKSGVGH